MALRLLIVQTIFDILTQAKTVK